jgi:hypothetical protein
MNIPLLIAGGIALVTASIHGIAGDAVLVRKIKVEALPSTPFGGPAQSKVLIRASWHLLTLVFVILAVALFVSGIRDTSDFAPGVAYLAGALYTGFAVTTMGVTLVRNGARGLVAHPAPLIFAAGCAVIWWGAIGVS